MAIAVNIDSVTTADGAVTSAPHKISDKSGKTIATVAFTATADGGPIRRWIILGDPTNHNTGTPFGKRGMICGGGDRCGQPSAVSLAMDSGEQVTEDAEYGERGSLAEGDHDVVVYAISEEDGWSA